MCVSLLYAHCLIFANFMKFKTLFILFFLSVKDKDINSTLIDLEQFIISIVYFSIID